MNCNAASHPPLAYPRLPRGIPQGAFTLVELMVVIAAIGVLISVLLPALAAARQEGVRARCVSNLRQLGLATQLYWQDHEDKAFRYLGPATNGGQVYWFGWLEPWDGANEGRRAFDPSYGVLYPYLQGKGVDLCPALRRHGRFKFKAAGATRGYGYNWHLSRPLHKPPLDMSRVPHPTDTVLMADAAQINTFQFPATPDNPLLEEFYYVSASERTAHFRHRRLANAVFCDGHVDLEGPVSGSLDSNMPQERVGRLRPEILRVP